MKKKFISVIGIFAIFVSVLTVASCGSKGVKSDPNDVDSESEAIEMMESVFKGPYSKRAIKVKMDTVMTMYKLTINKDNYLKAANTLVTLRKGSKKDINEIDILNHMLNENGSSKGKSFDEQAGLSAKALES